jgi:hypothetical protein
MGMRLGFLGTNFLEGLSEVALGQSAGAHGGAETPKRCHGSVTTTSPDVREKPRILPGRQLVNNSQRQLAGGSDGQLKQVCFHAEKIQHRTEQPGRFQD